MEENPEDNGNKPMNSQRKKCELCTKEVKSEQELKNHKKFNHNLSSENKVNKKILPNTKSALEKHISKVSQKGGGQQYRELCKLQERVRNDLQVKL